MPQFGGNKCFGSDIERLPCVDNPPCDVPGVWSAWMGWQRCDCNTGMQERIRLCKGTKGCIGKGKIDRSCDPLWLTENCPQGGKYIF